MDTDRRSDPLRRDLLDLKEQGCNLLIVNDAASVDAICSRLGGQTRHVRRRCYVPITTTVASVLERHSPSPRHGAYFGVVDATSAGAVRGTVAPIQPGQLNANAEWYTRFDDLRDLSGLARQIESHLDRFGTQGGPLEPGEVRLCVESLDPFFDDIDTDAGEVQSFLESVTQLVKSHRAIGHFHVASGTAPEIAFEPLFDATVRIRTTDDGIVQQHWTLHETDVETDWLPLEHR